MRKEEDDLGRKGIKKQFWFSKDQAEELSWKAEKACLTESALIRMLISGYHPPAAPGMEFYEHLNKLTKEASRMQLSAELLKDPEIKEVYKKTASDINKLEMEIRRRFLTGEREKIEWQ